MRYFALMLPLTLIGCAQTGLSPEGERAHYEAQKAAAKQPTLSIECPDGCKFGSLTYHDPRGTNIEQPEVRTPVKDVTGMAVDAALGIAPWIAVDSIATQGIRAAQGDVRDSHNRTDKRRDTFGDGSVAGDRVDDSTRNSGRIDSPSTDESVDNEGRIDSPNINRESGNGQTSDTSQATSSGTDGPP